MNQDEIKYTSMKISILKFLILICFLAFVTNAQAQKPRDLEEAITFFEKHWSKKTKNEFSSKSELEATSDAHFGTGMWIRNHWVYGDRNPKLVTYFVNLGVRAPDDISGIILTSLHRRLNGRDIDLEGQLKFHNSFWQFRESRDSLCRARSVEMYARYSIGDTVRILMHVRDSSASYFLLPGLEWPFDDRFDLSLVGTISKKYFVTIEDDAFISVEIVSMSRSVLIFDKPAVVGSVIDFSLRKVTME